MRTPIAGYFGGKSTLAPNIAELLPRHEHYVEPFAGSLAVLLAKPRSPLETVNDLDGDLMTFWRVLRDSPAELIRACELTPHSRAEHEAAYQREGCDDLERARRVWVALTQGRNGSLIPTGWRFQVTKSTSGSSYPTKVANSARKMQAVAERLSSVSLECLPALEIVARYGQAASVLLYIDPPYLGQTRGENGRARYQCDMTSAIEHTEFLDALLSCRATVVVSGYTSPLYDKKLADWHVSKLSAQTQDRNDRTEVLWSNRPLTHQASLFDGVA